CSRAKRKRPADRQGGWPRGRRGCDASRSRPPAACSWHVSCYLERRGEGRTSDRGGFQLHDPVGGLGMGDDLFHTIPTVFDLLALAICLGALGCRVWVLSTVSTPSGSIALDGLLASLWRLLAVCLAALVMSSVGELAGRAAEMSNRPLSAILPVLPTILLRT